ncbi:MAG: MASE1 domain-containing protein, partial [Dokdonella sp.]
MLVALTSSAGLVLARDADGVPPIWYTSGILLGLLLRSPSRHWPAILCAGFVGDLLAYLVIGRSMALGITLTLCNVLEVFVASWAIRRQVGDDLEPARLLAWARTGLLWSVIASALSGALAAWVLWQAKSVPAWQTLSVRYPAHVLGIIIMTPMVLASTRQVFADMLSPGRVRNTVLALGLLVATTAAVFLQDTTTLLFVIFPPLVYVVFQLGFAGAAIGV